MAEMYVLKAAIINYHAQQQTADMQLASNLVNGFGH